APPAAAPAAGAPSEAVAERVAWLAQHGGGTARIKLNPPALGEIEIEVRLRGGVADVAVRTRESATQLLLAAERGTVSHILAARDIRIEDFSVQHDAPDEPRFGAGADTASREHESEDSREGGGDAAPHRSARGAAERGAAPAHAASAAARPAAGETSTRLDLRV
ncbi:MAG: hypothetical protein DCC71_25525, partial [Proteobacteria bacterium]